MGIVGAEREPFQDCSVTASGGQQCTAPNDIKPDWNNLLDRSEEYGERQLLEHHEHEIQEKTERRLLQVAKYMRELVLAQDKFKYVRRKCQNQYEHCTLWAAIGECEKNPNFMQLKCAPACMSCDQLSTELRCPFDPEHASHTWLPGDVNKFFQRITTDPKYQGLMNLTIYSRPGMESKYTINNTKRESPWIVAFDGFLTDEECDTLVELGAARGYKRSEDTAEEESLDGTLGGQRSDGRTSTNAWCMDDCYEHPIAQRVLQKIENLTQIPDNHAEHLQILRYQVGQFYELHHDYVPRDLKRPQGVRMLTVFLYLNNVPAGGGTRFPFLNITVVPKKGRALLWPSVRNQRPNSRDPSTYHEALPVQEGEKHAANAWFHQRDFKTPFAARCH